MSESEREEKNCKNEATQFAEIIKANKKSYRSKPTHNIK